MSKSVILAPTDFSDWSIRSVRLALAIARRLEAQLRLLHVDHLPEFTHRMSEQIAPETWESYLHERTQSLHRHLDDLARTLGDAEIEGRIVRDDTAEAIVSQAAEPGVELVVLAPHGAGGSERFLIGNVTFEVAANARCPVLVTRHAMGTRLPPDGSFEHPLLASSEEPRELSTRLIAALTAPGASVDVVHVLEPTSPAIGPDLPRVAAESGSKRRTRLKALLEQTARALSDLRIGAKTELEAGEPAGVLLSHMAANENDLVIVGARSSHAQPGMLGSVTRRLLQHSPVPVAIVPLISTSEMEPRAGGD